MKDVFDLDLNDKIYDAIKDAKEIYDSLSCSDILSEEYNDLAIIEIAKMVLSLRK